MRSAEERVERLSAQIRALVSSWALARVVAALQAMRGIALLTAVTLVAEAGDLTRFANPRQLMAYFGLVPSEHSSGGKRRLGGITKAGSSAGRAALVEAAWTYRLPARLGPGILARQDGLPEAVRTFAWKAQTRLCARYRRLVAAGKKPQVVVVAIARELAAFVWAIVRALGPAPVAVA